MLRGENWENGQWKFVGQKILGRLAGELVFFANSFFSNKYLIRALTFYYENRKHPT